MAAFAKYDGIDGESKDANHDKWIDVLSIDWGSNKPGGGATGQSRRRGTVVVEDLRLTMEFEKSTPKLLEKMNKGEVIPKLEIEQTANYGGSRKTYIKYELKNVQVTALDYSAVGNDESPPTITVSNNFEEYKMTYTEYDSEGSSKGNAETTWKVEEGEK
jgi:type VI secretion system secreted protein Hcp